MESKCQPLVSGFLNKMSAMHAHCLRRLHS